MDHYESVKQYEKDYAFIPVVKDMFADVVTPITLLKKLSTIGEYYYLLESVEGGEKWGRYSFLGVHPILRIYGKSGEVTVEKDRIKETQRKDPMEALRGLLNEYKSPKIEGMPPFTGGFVGYFSYEMIGYAEPKLKLKQNEMQDFDFMLFDKVIAYDHLAQKIIIIANYKSSEGIQGYLRAESEIIKLIEVIKEERMIKSEPVSSNVTFTCNTTKEEYCAMVEKTKQYIREGDIFQGVISRRFEAEYEGSLINAYRILRTTNPSPYMYYINNGELEIAGSSPETMVKLENNLLTTFPVAGTRPRGKTKEEDLELEKELLKDEKELSEHNMLVDLARNDIGKISEYGSVLVKEYINIHRFSRVMHIASTVTGELKKGKDCCDAVTALLPAGTLSGAPKFRACEIINELEPEARGVYAGAIGYINLSGDLDVCIGIRTAVKKGNKVYVQAGAGIVADSVPETEYEESQNKAGAVIEAIKRASEVNGL